MPRRKTRCWEGFDDKDSGEFVHQSVGVFQSFADELVENPDLAFEDSTAATMAEELAAAIRSGSYRCASKHLTPTG